MTSKEALYNINWAFHTAYNDREKHFQRALGEVKKDLDLLEELETLKNYYEPFKQFLEDMFEKGHNTDLAKIKEWLEK